jgi:NTE family protein
MMNELDDDAAPDPSDFSGATPANGVGLCLSGGGYRAMVFHLGVLRRFNETGWLQKLTRVAAVSGGSIIAAQLGMAWKKLGFSNGVATNFDVLVGNPILGLAAKTIDRKAILVGVLLPGSISQRVQAAYDKLLFHGATLQALPGKGEGPTFILLATNLSNAALWRFSRAYMRDWRGDSVDNPNLSLAHAVAASSAFPPFLSPSVLDIPDRATLHLTDGGVYDNLGLEPIVKRCKIVFVSDGGGTFGESAKPHTDWLRGTLRVLNTVDVEVRRLRRRQINGLLASGQRGGAFFAINTNYARFPNRSPALPVTGAATKELAATKTRLAKLDPQRCRKLVNWGYAAADAALRSYVDPGLAQPAGFPYPAEALE